jgi:hypothetical protein
MNQMNHKDNKEIINDLYRNPQLFRFLLLLQKR